jgi:LPXTG-motif cell wall-anchored protein
VVVPPVAVKPAAVVAAQPLAETGVDAGLVGAAAALLLGAGAAGLLLARRRASN